MKIETNDLIIRNFELSDENDLCEYMLQRVNANKKLKRKKEVFPKG